MAACGVIEEFKTQRSFVRRIRSLLHAFATSVRRTWYEFTGGRRTVGILDGSDLRPSELKSFAIQHAVATIAFHPRLSLGIHRAAVEELAAVQPRWIPRSISERAVRRKYDRQLEHLALHRSSGAVILLSAGMDDAPRVPTGYFFVKSPPQASSHAGSNSQIVQILRNSGLPMAEADGTLSQRLRNAAEGLSTSGCPPVADAYLKFRCAASDADRFLALLGAFEIVVKVLTVILLAEGAEPLQPKGVAIPKALRKPTLGQWLHSLRDFSGEREARSDSCRALVARFLGGQSTEPQHSAFAASVACGAVDEAASSPMSTHAWLWWLKELRDVTRGHGVVSDEVSIHLWHPLYAAFVEMIHELRLLMIEAVYEVNDAMPRQMQGWRRGALRDVNSDVVRNADSPERVMDLVMRIPGQALTLGPYVVAASQTCLSWLRGDGANNVYVDSLSGLTLSTRDGYVDATQFGRLNDQDEMLLKDAFLQVFRTSGVPAAPETSALEEAPAHGTRTSH